MPRVRKTQSRAKDFYDGAGKGRKRCANMVCSLFVLGLALGGPQVRRAEVDLQTVICQGPSGSRESVAAAKLQEPAKASSTLRGRPFNQA
jgi:hypothetical protein